MDDGEKKRKKKENQDTYNKAYYEKLKADEQRYKRFLDQQQKYREETKRDTGKYERLKEQKKIYIRDPENKDRMYKQNREYRARQREKNREPKNKEVIDRYREIIKDVNKEINKEVKEMAKGDTPAEKRARRKVREIEEQNNKSALAVPVISSSSSFPPLSSSSAIDQYNEIIEDIDRRINARQQSSSSSAMPLLGAESPFPYFFAPPTPMQSSSSFSVPMRDDYRNYEFDENDLDKDDLNFAFLDYDT